VVGEACASRYGCVMWRIQKEVFAVSEASVRRRGGGGMRMVYTVNLIDSREEKTNEESYATTNQRINPSILDVVYYESIR
jgi:hypothetical protein